MGTREASAAPAASFMTAHSEVILPLPARRGVTGPDNALFVEVHPADSPEVRFSKVVPAERAWLLVSSPSHLTTKDHPREAPHP